MFSFCYRLLTFLPQEDYTQPCEASASDRSSFHTVKFSSYYGEGCVNLRSGLGDGRFYSFFGSHDA